MKACFYLCLTWHTKHTELNIIALFYTSKLKLLEAKDIFLHKWVLYNFLFCLSVMVSRLIRQTYRECYPWDAPLFYLVIQGPS